MHFFIKVTNFGFLNKLMRINIRAEKIENFSISIFIIILISIFQNFSIIDFERIDYCES